ncbi:unnamed protein product [Effrenium voratum]|nr:unnamed protein product [Effrenium voratum]|mmetsp:Transcript_116559/g.277096  ORF Transcript_116559/g.277096 Transcript_116559/m.277096 type:complete len:494 (-) Transcript_116559:124-1605(-)|eukprot:CAMPEP_0181471136 /NCGR_PEP_ID=MMETSP1110-20121109/38917_1 /TAXON_ID=174948 /ORGANISM="Symbiodinium sp., Strain CCMP421" /LENGTH=493 /DNA_ID=CAMNT_0023596141 /DNA_START=27 /DNA_END=1508 /DNA_ORIENTATION=-
MCEFDACIIGAGPGGLAALSALIEPYTCDHLSEDQTTRAACALRKHRSLQVCVVDPEPWLSTWHKRFASLGIRWLRSPTGAHPDLFDARSLLAYAAMHGRTSELLESGAVDQELHALAEAHTGLWHLPSNKLFEDFCHDLASRLPHTFIQGMAAAVKGSDGNFTVRLADGRELKAKAVVLALGVPGPQRVPPALSQVPERFMFHADFGLGSRLKELSNKEVLVIGGGLTAVQAAQLAMRRGCRVTLCSRRPLTTRHFDVKSTWFDRRVANRHHFEFFEQPLEDRLKHIKVSRGGGSVPPMYMTDLRKAEARGKVELRCEEVQFQAVLPDAARPVQVLIGTEVRHFDLVLNACGHCPDCRNLPLISELLTDFPVDVVGGFPVVSQDLQWGSLSQLFVMGALASLQVGPDAGNLMGLRRAAHIVANVLGLRDWLKDTASVLGNVRGNRYAALGAPDSDSESDRSSDSGEFAELKSSDAAEASTDASSNSSFCLER